MDSGHSFIFQAQRYLKGSGCYAFYILTKGKTGVDVGVGINTRAKR